MIVGIAGSVREGSYTQAVLRYILQETGLSYQELPLDLPIFVGHQTSDEITRFKKAMQEAKGVLIATPEYHGSMSGILKNALDFLDDELAGKVVGVVAILGGAYGGTSLEHLRTVMHKLKAWTLPQDLVIVRSNLIFDKEGRVTSPELEKRLKAFAEQFAQAL